MRKALFLHSQFSKQSGAALIVGLIMLLLLTLVGVAGMRDTLLQQKMVSSSKDREVALQAAESALRFASNELTTPTQLNITNSNGIYDLNVPSSEALFLRNGTESAFWNSWNWSNAVEYGLTLDGVASQNPPKYVIEKLPLDGYGTSEGGTGGSGAAGGIVSAADPIGEPDVVTGAGFDGTVYRVTVRAVGSTPDAVVLLQGTVRRVDPKL